MDTVASHCLLYNRDFIMFIDREHGKLKAGIHFTFAKIFAPVCSLDESILAVESQSQSADFAYRQS